MEGQADARADSASVYSSASQESSWQRVENNLWGAEGHEAREELPARLVTLPLLNEVCVG